MPLVGVLRAVRRRWYVVLAGVLVTLLLAGRGAQDYGSYDTSASVLFFPPVSSANPNGYVDGGGNVITAAGFVAARMRAPEVKAALARRGMTADYTVVMHNSGNQFADNFDRAAIDLTVSGPDPATTSRSVALLGAEIAAQLDAAQRSARADRRDWIRTQLSPDNPGVLHVAGSPLRAVAGSVLLGLALTLVVAVGLDDRLRRRSARAGARAPDTREPVAVD